jgi:hypothetical protein
MNAVTGNASTRSGRKLHFSNFKFSMFPLN